MRSISRSSSCRQSGAGCRGKASIKWTSHPLRQRHCVRSKAIQLRLFAAPHRRVFASTALADDDPSCFDGVRRGSLDAEDHLTGKRVEPWRAIADPTRQWVTMIGVAVAVGIAFFLAARLGLSLLTEPDGVAVFWPASGVAAGALIALGPRARWPVAIGVAVATIAANLLGDRTFASAATFALCNAGEALLAAGLIERWFGSGFTLDRLSQVLGLLAAAVLATAISGAAGTLAFKLFHFSTVPSLTIWQHWVASGAIGIVTVAPLLIGIGAAVRNPPSPNEATEAALALLAVTLLTALVVYLPRGAWVSVVTIALLGPAVAVAGGSLPAGVRRGGRVHRFADNRVDDNLWHWAFRRPQSPDRRSHRERPGRDPEGFARHARSCRAVRGAASAAGCAPRGGGPAGRGPGGRRGDGVRMGCPHRFFASQCQRREGSWLRPASPPDDRPLSRR